VEEVSKEVEMSTEKTQWLLLFVMNLKDSLKEYTESFESNKDELHNHILNFIEADTARLLDQVLEENKELDLKQIVWKAINQIQFNVYCLLIIGTKIRGSKENG